MNLNAILSLTVPRVATIAATFNITINTSRILTNVNMYLIIFLAMLVFPISSDSKYDKLRRSLPKRKT